MCIKILRNRFMIEQKRIYYFDKLKIFAAIAVIMIHVSAQKWYSAKLMSTEWMLFTVLDAVSRWAVPIFIMISGSLFLSRERGIRHILKNNFLRIITAFVFWSALYVAADALQGKEMTFAEGFKDFAGGHYHLWYLFTIAALYLIVPFLRKIIESEKLMKYLLIVSFVFSIVLPFAIGILSVYSKYWHTVVNTVSGKINLSFVRGYLFYFVFGYWLSQKEISKKMRIIAYISGFAGAASIVTFTALASFHTGKANTVFLNNYTFGCVLESAALFISFKYNGDKRTPSERGGKIIRTLSKYTFGVYLCHVMVLEFISKTLHFDTLSMNPFLSVPLLVFVVGTASLIITAILNQIPVIKKYIV